MSLRECECVGVLLVLIYTYFYLFLFLLLLYTCSILCLPLLAKHSFAKTVLEGKRGPLTPYLCSVHRLSHALHQSSLFSPPARPASGFYVKFYRTVPPVPRLVVPVNEGTSAKEVITARSRSARVGSV